MRCQPHSWKNILAKSAFTRKKQKNSSKTGFSRALRFEQCEDRRMLATLTVNSLLDNTIGGDGLLTLREAIIQAEV